MKKMMFVVVVCCLIASIAFAAAPAKGRKVVPGPNAAVPPQGGDALQWIDYWNTSSVNYYTWGGNFYMSNLFKPQGTWYPLDVVALEVLMVGLDGNTATGAAGTLNGAAVFNAGGTAVLARELNIPAQVGVWTLVNLTTPPRINTGNFYGGLWNSNDAAMIDLGYQCTAANWTPPPTEPFNCIFYSGATAGGNGAWAGNDCGSLWPTVSAASIRAQVNTNVPVELMRFDVE
jgi:hypothetical protein